MGLILVPASRIRRWVENFEERHGAVSLAVRDGALAGGAEDGSTFEARLPLDSTYGGPPEVDAFGLAMQPDGEWGVLLVRKGGFAIARLRGDEMVEHKVGRRHVQGRTRAGGQSQQRFARRRANQARRANEAAADHAVRLLGDAALRVVTGGDHAAVDDVLADPRLRRLTLVGPWLPVPDPRRAVLDGAVADAMSARVDVLNA